MFLPVLESQKDTWFWSSSVRESSSNIHETKFKDSWFNQFKKFFKSYQIWSEHLLLYILLEQSSKKILD